MNWNNEIVGLWPTTLLRKEIHDQALLDRLEVLAENNASIGEDEWLLDPDAAIKQLRDHIASAAGAYFQHLDTPNPPPWRLRARVEKLAYGESRALQSRPGAYLSGILYLRAPKDIEPSHLRNDVHPGHLTLLDPRPGFNMCSIEGDPYHNQNLMVDPQPGLFLMWPAYVGFYQHPNLSRSAQHYICFDIVPSEHASAKSESKGRWDGDIHDMWPTALIKRRLPGYEQRNRELIDIIDSLERENPDLTTDFNSERFRSYKHPAMDWLMSSINQSVTAYLKQIGIKQEISWKISSWSNINRFGDYHSPHNHPWSYLSGTYYVQIPDPESKNDGHDDPEAACISHYDPRSGMSRYAFGPDSRGSNVHTVRPVPGAMLIWPSPVHHFVHPNLSTGKRYSISFNIHLNR